MTLYGWTLDQWAIVYQWAEAAGLTKLSDAELRREWIRRGGLTNGPTGSLTI